MLLLYYCVSAANLTKNIFTINHKEHIHGVWVACDALRDEHVALLWCIILTCDIPTAFLPGFSLVPVFFVLEVKYTPTHSHCVASDQPTITLGTCCVIFNHVRVTCLW